MSASINRTNKKNNVKTIIKIEKVIDRFYSIYSKLYLLNNSFNSSSEPAINQTLIYQ